VQGPHLSREPLLHREDRSGQIHLHLRQLTSQFVTQRDRLAKLFVPHRDEATIVAKKEQPLNDQSRTMASSAFEGDLMALVHLTNWQVPIGNRQMLIGSGTDGPKPGNIETHRSLLL